MKPMLHRFTEMKEEEETVKAKSIAEQYGVEIPEECRPYNGDYSPGLDHFPEDFTVGGKTIAELSKYSGRAEPSDPSPSVGKQP